MRDIKRIPKVLKEIRKIWEQYPDLRFTQFMENLHTQLGDTYYWEDDKLIEVLKDFYKGGRNER